LVSVLAEVGAIQAGAVVADIGSGTGISTEPFLDRGHPVFAVEPNAAMRRAAEAAYGGRPGFVSVDGSAEASTLAVASVDLVVCAQAFHWFDPRRAKAEFRRILRSPKWVALVWNRRSTQESGFLRAYEELLVRFGTDYTSIRHERIDDSVLGPFFGGAYSFRALPNEQRFDFAGLEDRLLSTSYTPSAGDPARTDMLRELRVVFDAHQVDGQVRMLYQTQIHVGRLADT
jgi:SAM-dependent methyltransferase